MLDMVDAASLLLRLEMEGVNLGHERWKALKCVVEVNDFSLSEFLSYTYFAFAATHR